LILLSPVIAFPAPGDVGIDAPRGIVDCLLQGHVRRIGGNIYQMPQRPARIPASECKIRGGDYLLYDRANFETSLRHWITKAESGSGDAEAMLYVGEIYEQGMGRDPDYAAAANWYKKASDAGSTTAMIGLAHLYKTGQGVPLDLAAAQALYSRAFGSNIPIPLDPTSVKGADQRVETLISEVDEVRRQKIAVELELQAATEQLVNARRALDDKLADDGGNNALIGELRASIAQQKNVIAAYSSDLDTMKAENAELTSLRQLFEEQRIETAMLEALLAAADSEVGRSRATLTAQRQALDAKEAEFSALLADDNAERESLKASSRERDKLRDRTRVLEAALRKAEEDRVLYQALANDAATQEDRVAALTARISVLQQQSSSVQSDFESIRSELAVAQRQLDAQIESAMASEQVSDASNTARDAEVQRLRAAVERAEQETSRHSDDIDRLSRQSAELEGLRADLEREQAQSNRLQQLLTDSQSRYTDSNTRLEQINAERTRLENEIADLRASASEKDQELLRRRESELRSASDEVDTLQARISQSEEEFRRYEQQMVDTATRQSEAIENLRSAVASSHAEREQLEGQLSSTNQQLASAQADLNFERQRYTEVQDALREARVQATADSAGLEAKESQLDQRARQVSLLQQEIDRLNEESNRHASQINELQARAQAKKIEFAGPRIVMLEPSENLLADTTMAARGDGQTRGISVVAATRLSETKMIRGQIDAPAGLAKLTINGFPVNFDTHNSFAQSLVLDSESKHIRIVALDHNGKQDVKEFEYRIDGTVGQVATIHSKAARFEQSRNDALDHLKYYALIIANQNYENDFVRDLGTPIADAEAIRDVLVERYGFQVDILKDATKDMIEEALERIFWFEENDDVEENDKDAILIYYAGHGSGSDSRNNDAYYWLPVDSKYNSPRTWFKTRKLEDYMQTSATKQIMIVADSCFAGSVLSRDGIFAPHASLKSRNWRKFLTEYTERKKSRYVLTSGGLAPVLDGGGGKHSVFARAFLDVLLANNEIISAARIHEQVAPIVLNLAERQDFKQTPFFGYLRSAGHAFGNFYLPAPRYAAQPAAAKSDQITIPIASIVAQVER